MGDIMKKFIFPLCIFTLLVSCASGPLETRKTMGSLSPNVMPKANESEILIQYPSTLFYDADGLINVFVDGEMMAQVEPNKSERIIVSNGVHYIKILQPGGRKVNISKKIDIDSQRMIFNVSRVFFIHSLQKEKVINKTTGLNTALNAIGKNLVEKLPQNATIAIINISTRRSGDAKAVISGLEQSLVNSKQFFIVDRNELDAISREENFQLSGNVSDEDAVSIGRKTAASIIITGEIIESSSGRILSVKALHVESANIITVEREHF
jgi:hypothetical protein